MDLVPSGNELCSAFGPVYKTRVVSPSRSESNPCSCGIRGVPWVLSPSLYSCNFKVKVGGVGLGRTSFRKKKKIFMESPVHAWLLENVPSWDDDVVSVARFKHLSGQRPDWEPRFLFWKDVIIRVARHLNLLTLDTHAVQCSWFLRGGLTPLCIKEVLLEMCRDGDLQTPEETQETLSSFSWLLQRIGKGILSGNVKVHEKVPARLVVTALVHERIMAISKSISETSWSATCVITMEHLDDICGGKMNSYIIKRELLRTKKGKTFFSEANRAIQGFKMSLTEDQVSDVSKMDSYMLHLYWTMEKLNTQINALDEAYSQSKQSAIRALNHNRTIAKRHVHRMHIVKTSKQKCWEFQGKLQEVLLFISQAETTKQVSEALRLGTDALKEHLIPLEDIEECMNEIDAAVLGHAEVNQVLASPLNSMQVEDFESELTNLELELLNGESEASSVVVPSTASEAGSQEQQSRPSTASVDAIEQSMKRIALA